jgi:hypothetical protein
MPDMTGNISLGYDIGGFSGRISAYWQGATITSAQAQVQALDVNHYQYMRMDLKVQQKIKKVKGLMIFMDIENLTNYPDKNVLTNYPDKITFAEKYGVSGKLGVRYRN